MNYQSLFKKGVVGLLVAITSPAIKAQDTLHITLQQAEQKFISNNLQLLAEKYNININKALELQERLYNNPTLQLSTASYSASRKKIIDAGPGGQYDVSFQQLITLAGKRNKRIKLAAINTQQAENNFYDLMRTLQYSLRSTFFNAGYLYHSINAYKTQLETLDKLNASYSELQQKGIVTLKDAVRIKSLLYSLRAEQAGLINQLNDAIADLQLLLQDNQHFYLPDLPAATSGEAISKLQLTALVDTAYSNRADLLLANNNLLYSQQNYQLQKALRVPDLTLGAEFDKRGSYVDNASFINLAIDLPFFNRNQGNIKAAKLQITQSETQLDLQKKIVENDVQRAYLKVLNTDKIFQSFDPGFKEQFEQLLKGVTDNFLQRNISIIEFTDLIESYKNNILQLNQVENDRMQAIQALNFATGKTIID